jgi:translation initiation factor 1
MFHAGRAVYLRRASFLPHDRAMAGRGNARIVYSTDAGRMCPGCGWPAANCRCSKSAAAKEAIPARIVAKLRVEKKGRGGKTVSVVDGLPNNATFLKELCLELKRACGTGGVVVDGGIELQGDLRDRLREFLGKRGFVVRG